MKRRSFLLGALALAAEAGCGGGSSTTGGGTTVSTPGGTTRSGYKIAPLLPVQVANFGPVFFGLPRGLNNSGEVVGGGFQGVGETTVPILPFMTVNGVTTALPILPAAESQYGTDAMDVNDSGTIVGVTYAYSSNAGTPVLWKNGVISLVPGFTATNRLYDRLFINSSGMIAGYSSVTYNAQGNSAPSPEDFIWNNGTVTNIPLPAGNLISLTGFNDAGIVVGNTVDALLFPADPRFPVLSHAYSGSSAGFTELPAIDPTLGVIATAINNAGKIVGTGLVKDSAGNQQTHAVMWTNGTLTDLHSAFPGATRSEALHIDNNGAVYGSYSMDKITNATYFSSYNHTYYVYKNGTVTNLTATLLTSTGWTLDPIANNFIPAIVLVNDRGQMVANAYPPGGGGIQSINGSTKVLISPPGV